MQSDPLSATFGALADPTRRAILARLSHGDASAGELVRPFDISLPSISRHLKVLETAGLIVREKDAQCRICRLRTERQHRRPAFLRRVRRAVLFDQLGGARGDLPARLQPRRPRYLHPPGRGLRAERPGLGPHGPGPPAFETMPPDAPS